MPWGVLFSLARWSVIAPLPCSTIMCSKFRYHRPNILVLHLSPLGFLFYFFHNENVVQMLRCLRLAGQITGNQIIQKRNSNARDRREIMGFYELACPTNRRCPEFHFRLGWNCLRKGYLFLPFLFHWSAYSCSKL